MESKLKEAMPVAKNQPKAKASTQEHLDIEDIVDDLVIMKNGWVALIMSTTAVNFDLLSEAEQDATIYAYGALLNSLTFPIQILVRSKKADITSYFASLEEAENSQLNPDLKRQIQKYKDFIQSTVQQKTVLDKKFYIIINFSPLELGLKGLTGKKTNTPKNKSRLITDAKAALMPKRDHIIKQTARLGLITKQLTTQEQIELFYDIYNPAPAGTQRVLLDNSSYTTPIVEPALEVPVPAPEQSSFQVSKAGYQTPDISQPEPGIRNPEPDLRPAPPPTTSGLDLRQDIKPAPDLTAQQPDNPQTQLRPVPPPQAPSPPQAPNSLPTHQANALQGLQEATARAAQIVNRPVVNQTPISQPNNNRP